MKRFFKTKLPLHQASPFFLTWITMLMSFIAALTLFASISLFNIVSHWNSVISGSLTIQQPTYDLNGIARVEDAVKELADIQELLKKENFVISYHLLDDDEIEKLMTPWLGQLTQINELPIPYLIDVQLKENTTFSLENFKTKINAIAPYAQVDSHRIWLSHLVNIAKGIQKTIFVILILLILTTAFTVIYTTRSSLLVQENTLSLLQLMGAHDILLAFNLAKNSFWKGLLGSFFGFILSLPIVIIVITLMQSGKEPLFSYGALSQQQWFFICSIPIFFALLSFGTALMTALKKLRTF